MRMLFTSTIGTGHLLPVLALARAAADAGHDVRVATAAAQADRVAAAGLELVQLGQPTEAAYAEARATAGPEAAGTLFFGRLRPAAALPDLEEAARDADLVIAESGEFAGTVAAERLGHPCVRLHPGLVHGGGWEHLAAAEVATLRRAAGLPDDRVVERLFAVPQLSYFPAVLDARPAPGDVLRVRRPGLPQPADRPKDLVYVTFGTEVPGQSVFPELVRAAVAAARRTGYEIVVSTGSATGLDDLPGVSSAPWVDEPAVLARAAAVICHGGAGTMLNGLAAGVPMITVPLFADQPFNAAAVEAAGAGTTVRPGAELQERLTHALDEVLTNRPAGITAVSEAIAALPGIESAVRLLESTARTVPVS